MDMFKMRPGNTGKCNLNVKKDVTKPSCSISTSGTSEVMDGTEGM